jgi:membrane-associated phospholipid phosphatase
MDSLIFVEKCVILFNNSGFLNYFWQILTNLFPIILLSIIIYLIKKRKNFVILGLLALNIALGMLLKKIISIFYFTPRPYELLVLTKTNIVESSFFSNHTYFAFLCVFYIWYLTDNKIIKYSALILAIITAFSRIVLAQHYLVDILFGLIFAQIFFILSIKFYKKYHQSLSSSAKVSA